MAAALTVVLLAGVAIHRHGILGLASGKAFLGTALLLLILFPSVGIIGGLLAGSFYKAFLIGVGAQKSAPSLPVFFGEWLFASTAPVFAMLLLLVPSPP
jgi:hypothetical protein